MRAFARNVSLLLGTLGLISFSFGREVDRFEGRIDYAIESAGERWSYTVWIREGQWRSELRSESRLYEVRIGNIATNEVYFLNEAGKSYRRIGGEPRGESDSGERKPARVLPVDIERVVEEREEKQSLSGREARLSEVKGPGKRIEVWSSEELDGFTGWAMPRFKVIERKEPVLRAFFRRNDGLPLLVETARPSGKHAFSMKAMRIEQSAVDPQLLSIPAGWEEERPRKQRIPMGYGEPLELPDR